MDADILCRVYPSFQILVRMRTPGSAEAAGTGLAGAGRPFGGVLPAAGSEERKLFGQPFGTAFWAGRSLPAAGPDEQFGIRPAFPAMKLINRHGRKIAAYARGVKAKMHLSANAPASDEIRPSRAPSRHETRPRQERAEEPNVPPPRPIRRSRPSRHQPKRSPCWAPAARFRQSGPGVASAN
jgi:hypothetical protein